MKSDFSCRCLFYISVLAFRQAPLEPKYKMQPQVMRLSITVDPFGAPETYFKSGQFFPFPFSLQSPMHTVPLNPLHLKKI